MKSKAQALPMSTIVVTALSLLVLVIVGAFFITGQTQAGGGLAQFVRGSTGDITLEALRANCLTQCSTLASAVTVSACNDLTWTSVKSYCGKCNGVVTCQSILNDNGAICPSATYCNLATDLDCGDYENDMACNANTGVCEWDADNTECIAIL